MKNFNFFINRMVCHKDVRALTFSLLIFTILALFVLPSQAFSQNFTISTYNIFYHTPPEHENSWEMRKEHVAGIIRFHDIVLWGSQEGEHNQLQDLLEMLGQEYIGVARDDGATEGEHSAIFYDPDIFRVIEYDTFWLSRTPERPSMDWE